MQKQNTLNKFFKKANNETFLFLSNNRSFQRLSISEMKKIKGKGVDPTPAQVQALLILLNGGTGVLQAGGTAIFRVGVQMNDSHGADILADFNTQIALFASTNVGYNMLSRLQQVATQNNMHINVTGTNAPSGAAGQFYDTPVGGNLLLGLLDFSISPTDWNYKKQLAEHFGTIAHELFHAFIYISNGNTSYDNTVRCELDAYLMEFMACAEVDQKNDLSGNDSYTKWNTSLYSTGQAGRQATENLFKFNFAWYDIFRNKNLTIDNYNTLITYFKNTTQGSGGYYANLTDSEIDATVFTTSPFNDFYSNAYSQSSYYDSCIPYVLTFSPPRHPVGALDMFGFSWDVWYTMIDSANPPVYSGGVGNDPNGAYNNEDFDHGFNFWWALFNQSGIIDGHNYEEWYEDAENQYLDGGDEEPGEFWRDIHYNGYGSSYSHS
ncbi:MAG: hypothetical protein JNM14_08900 [Ferruginibacter sp.]|nr:hypothetical protein [Ferruginibacter sp.]